MKKIIAGRRPSGKWVLLEVWGYNLLDQFIEAGLERLFRETDHED